MMPLSRSSFVLVISFCGFFLSTLVCFFSVLVNSSDLLPIAEYKLLTPTKVNVLGVNNIKKVEPEIQKQKKNPSEQVFKDVDSTNYSLSGKNCRIIDGKIVRTNQEPARCLLATNNRSSLNVMNWRYIKNIRVDPGESGGETLLISFDGRHSWSWWDGKRWSSVTAQQLKSKNIGQIKDLGMTAKTLNSLTADKFTRNGGFRPGVATSMDLLIVLNITETSVNPPHVGVIGE